MAAEKLRFEKAVAWESCRRCGEDPKPNRFFCPDCHTIVTEQESLGSALPGSITHGPQAFKNSSPSVPDLSQDNILESMSEHT